MVIPAWIGFLIAVAAAFIAYRIGYTAGNDEGHAAGYIEGRKIGAKEGSKRGYAVGFDRGRRASSGGDDEDDEFAQPGPRWATAIMGVMIAGIVILGLASQSQSRSSQSRKPVVVQSPDQGSELPILERPTTPLPATVESGRSPASFPPSMQNRTRESHRPAIEELEPLPMVGINRAANPNANNTIYSLPGGFGGNNVSEASKQTSNQPHSSGTAPTSPSQDLAGESPGAKIAPRTDLRPSTELEPVSPLDVSIDELITPITAPPIDLDQSQPPLQLIEVQQENTPADDSGGWESLRTGMLP